MTAIFRRICGVNAILGFGIAWSSAIVRCAVAVGVILKQSGTVGYIIIYTCVKREGENIQLRDKKAETLKNKEWLCGVMSHSEKANTGVSSEGCFAWVICSDSDRNLIRGWHQALHYTFDPICQLLCECVFASARFPDTEHGFSTWDNNAAVSQILIFYRTWFVPDFNLGSDLKL